MKRMLVFLFFIFVPMLTANSEHAAPNLINGRPANPGEFPEVVYLTISGSRCTGTIIGERVLLTAAHCGTTGATAQFQIDQTLYSATLTRSGVYPGQDHDISLGLIDKKVNNVKYASIGGTASEGLEITLAGYGCINPGGGGGNDGVLRVGETIVTGFTGFDMISNSPGGAALCFGDSGGPAFILDGGGHKVIGINSKGNIRDTNYNARTDNQISREFFQQWSQKNQADICGINTDCGSTPPTPTPTPTSTGIPPPLGCKEKFDQLGQCLGYLR
jgi:hypothetical protein